MRAPGRPVRARAAGPCLHCGDLHVLQHARRALRHRPPSRHSENVTVACGFSGHGFKFVPVVGEILADLAIDGVTGHPISLFDPQRLVTT